MACTARSRSARGWRFVPITGGDFPKTWGYPMIISSGMSLPIGQEYSGEMKSYFAGTVQ
jgi:hypothetical protein